MKELVIILLVCVLVGMGSCAEGDWGDINSEDGLGDGEVLNESVSEGNLTDYGEAQDYVPGDTQSYGDSEEYTRDFYVALGVGGLGLLIVGVFVYFFLRGPKNKWKK